MKGIVEFPERHRVEQEAGDWLIRLDRDTEPSADELRDLREWLSRSPVHREELGSLARLWGNMNVLTELAVPLGNVSVRERTARQADRNGLGMVFLGLSIFFGGPNPADSLLKANGFYSTSIGEQQSTLLTDGSVVLLNTNSRIQVDYDGQFRDIRLLRGEAHFTVAENDVNPFRVFALNNRVDAVGTAFAVHLRGSEVRVAVSEGKVALVLHEQTFADPTTSEHAPVEELLGTLEAGEVGIIADGTSADAGTESFLRRIELANVDELLAWRQGFLAFSGESLETVVTEISRYTTVNIEIPDPAIRAIRIGGQVPIGELDAMLAALEDNFGLRVERLSDDHVVLSAVAEL